jgi:hypothetical protein
MTERIRGVSLAQYAIVIAGRADELPFADVLPLAGVPAKAWPAAEEAWGERLIDDLDADGPLTEELDARLAEARKLWSRPLPPLDTELRAWVDFERAWAREVDGDTFLADVGMRRADMARLGDLWSERLRADPELQREALRILADEPGKPPVPRPEPARIITTSERRSA